MVLIRFKVNTWDIGGQKAIRGYWKNYYESTDGIIWVIDVSDEERFNQTKEQLGTIIDTILNTVLFLNMSFCFVLDYCQFPFF